MKTGTQRPIRRRRRRACPPKPPLRRRRLPPATAARVARLFRYLASTTRLRLLHTLARAGELSVNRMAAAVGMKIQAVSNQLQRLAAAGIIRSRRAGTTVYYRLTDPCVVQLLERGLCLLVDSRRRRRGRGKKRI